MKKALCVMIAFILLAASYSPTVTNAAQQKVSANPTVSFTVDKVVLTSTTDAQALSFTLNLSNQSTQNVDYNQYGVRIKDKNGNKYSAQLTEKASARILPKVTQAFKYAATIPSDLYINQLSIEIFAWDYSLPSLIRVLGSFDVASAVDTTSNAPVIKQATVNLSALDAKLPKNTSATFTLLSSYSVLKSSGWVIYSDVLIENLSAKTIKLPDNLLFNLRDESSLFLLTSVVAGQNQSLLTKQRRIITFQTPFNSTATPTTKGLTFELRKRPLVVNTTGTVLGGLPMDPTFVDSRVGTVLTAPNLANNALTIAAEKATYNHNTFNNAIDVTVTLKNEGKTSLPVPALSGNFQVMDGSISTPAVEKETHPAALAAGESTTYHFKAEFPLALNESSIQLVITGVKSATQAISKPINVITLSTSHIQPGVTGLTEVTSLDLKDFDPTLPIHSMINLQVIRSFHSVSNGEPMINLEVSAENETAVALKLPASLLFEIRDSAELSYPTTAISGADQTIMPHQSIKFTLQTKTGSKDEQTAYSFDFVKKAATPAEANVLLDYIDISSSFANTQSVNSPLVTAIGRLGVTLKSTYRLASSSGDDILMSEVELENLDTKTVTLPNEDGLYAGYMLNDVDAGGKIVRIQTSPYLYPNQKTTIYIYTKVPYSTIAENGYIYVGDGTLNKQTSVWTSTHEWTELPYTLGANTLSAAVLDKEWVLTDAGRASSGKIVDSQIYDINNQKMLAVRILQTNKELRNGSIVPYTGYLTDTNGSVLSLKTTDDTAGTAILCNTCTALSTLWTVLPTGFTTENQSVIFGQKLDDQAFTTPQKYAFVSSGGTATSGSSLSNIAIYPYTISLQNPKLTLYSTGSGANSSAAYDIALDYTISKSIDAAGSAKNRSLQFTLTEGDGKVIKTWDTPLVGGGAWTTGSNKLSFANSEIPDLQSFINSRQLNVYEKFEGGTRLLGTIAIDWY
ncbi:hypothetical protein EHS13_18510 [Paenibacillus psychroresistens]|uniref:Uncharacterized protein n=1 Tax=Paenibacillus psychroresistens TaxID=1778678 RepID=A0A6B8RL15_9BACL|nr:hypothetical protein [Paenibacillus psychroresistens]QGQ96729.1 hypothetical protein EHS13_18510 [Paenibacillus psychroresistens]